MDEHRAVKKAYDELAEDYTDRAGFESLPEPVRRFCDELGPEDELLDAGAVGRVERH